MKHVLDADHPGLTTHHISAHTHTHTHSNSQKSMNVASSWRPQLCVNAFGHVGKCVMK